MSETAIFIFTKDRPQTLWPTLDAVLTTNRKIFLVDDSRKEENQYINSSFCERASNCKYLGKQAFDSLVAEIYGQQLHFSKSIFRDLGCSEWNLGYARNFALQYAKYNDFSKVLFIDDDIVPSARTIDEVFEALNDYDFAGANIIGLPDDSIVGHVTSALNVPQARMLSGGFLSFKPKSTSFMFLNCYNEDWIWLCLELLRKKGSIQKGQVYQQLTDPFMGYESKLAFQEFGEIVLQGVSMLTSLDDLKFLETESYWQFFVDERMLHLTELEGHAVVANELKYESILSQAKSEAMKISAKSVAELFQRYSVGLKLLNEIA